MKKIWKSNFPQRLVHSGICWGPRMWICAVRKQKTATLFREASDLQSVCYQTFPWQLVGRITHRNCFVCSQGAKQDINSSYPLFDHKKEDSVHRRPVDEVLSSLSSLWGWPQTCRPQWSIKIPPELLDIPSCDFFFFHQSKEFEQLILIYFYKTFKKFSWLQNVSDLVLQRG